MKPQRYATALQAYRLASKHITGKEAAARLKLTDGAEAHRYATIGSHITYAESCQLTDNEWLAIKTLVRMEARRIEAGTGSVKTPNVDYAAGKGSGWTARTVDKKLRVARTGDAFSTNRLGLLEHSVNGHIWLTPAGWAFAWATGLIKPSWKVPT